MYFKSVREDIRKDECDEDECDDTIDENTQNQTVSANLDKQTAKNSATWKHNWTKLIYMETIRL